MTPKKTHHTHKTTSHPKNNTHNTTSHLQVDAFQLKWNSKKFTVPFLGEMLAGLYSPVTPYSSITSFFLHYSTLLLHPRHSTLLFSITIIITLMRLHHHSRTTSSSYHTISPPHHITHHHHITSNHYHFTTHRPCSGSVAEEFPGEWVVEGRRQK